MDWRKTYFVNNGKHQELLDWLWELIPDKKPVPRAHRRLELLRMACMCYRDYYNNELRNLGREFRNIFGFGLEDFRRSEGKYRAKMEKTMDLIILDAANEQGEE